MPHPVFEAACVLKKHLWKERMNNEPADVVLLLRPISFLNASLQVLSKLWAPG